MSPAIDRYALLPAVRAFLDRDVHHLFVGGDRTPAVDGRSLPTVDPSSGEELGRVALAGAADVELAVRAARRAFEELWRPLAPAARGKLLADLAEVLERHADELAQLESLDNGKPVNAAARVDIPLAVEHLRYYSGWPTKIEGETIPVSAPQTLVYTRKEPIGVCAQIIPWNFPLMMAVWKIAPALAAGCTVILKPAEQTPLTALRLGELVQEAGIPDGVVNILSGDGTTGAALVDHPGVDKIAFTGSTSVGREIGRKAGESLKRVSLELGGKSPNIILPDAEVGGSVRAAFQAIYFNAGQVCQAGSRLFVPRSKFDDVIDALADRARAARVGPGLDSSTQIGPLVSKEQLTRVREYIELGRDEGAEAVVDGSAAGDAPGYFVRPTLFTGVTDDMRIAREEIFGPVLVAMPYDDLDEVARRANDTQYGLAAYVWTSDLRAAHRLAAVLEAGSVYINSAGMTDPAAPFGGFKASGIGREMGHANLDAYLELKTVWTSFA